MPRRRNPVGVAAGKLILAIQKERSEALAESDVHLSQQVLDRAHVLLQASQSSLVLNLLDGRSVEDYLDPVWIEAHSAVRPSVDAFVAALNEHEKR